MIPSEFGKPEAGMSYQEWDDRRKFKRYISDMSARFNLSSDDSAAGTGSILNISRGGMFVHAAKPLPVGTDLKMKISIVTPFGEQQDLSCEVKVVWICTRPGEEGMGMMFTKIDRHSQYAMLASAYRGHD